MTTSNPLNVTVLSERPGEAAARSQNRVAAKRRNGRLKRKRWCLLGLAVVMLATSGWFATHRGVDPTLVQTAAVAREDLQAKVTANGKVQAPRKVDISATIAGQVTHIAVKEGDRGRKGQLLLQIDSAHPRAAARRRAASMQALLRDLDSPL